MNTDDEIAQATENAVRAAARMVTSSAANLLYADPHNWSTRPCGTCRAITALLGFDFGCNRYAKEKGSTRVAG
jgi:hypothetical protein